VNQTEINDYEVLKQIISKNPNKEIEFEIQRSKNNCDITTQINCDFDKMYLTVIPGVDGKI
jgi:hypothetical protein